MHARGPSPWCPPEVVPTALGSSATSTRLRLGVDPRDQPASVAVLDERERVVALAVLCPRRGVRTALGGDVDVRDDDALSLEALGGLRARGAPLRPGVPAVDRVQRLGRQVVARAGVVSKRELLDYCLHIATLSPF